MKKSRPQAYQELVVILGKKFGIGGGCFNFGSTFYSLSLVSIGGQAEANLPASSLPPLNEITSNAHTEENLTPNPGESSLDDTRLGPPTSEPTNPTRLLSCFRRGFLIILASVIKGMPLPRGRFIPDFSPAPG